MQEPKPKSPEIQISPIELARVLTEWLDEEDENSATGQNAILDKEDMGAKAIDYEKLMSHWNRSSTLFKRFGLACERGVGEEDEAFAQIIGNAQMRLAGHSRIFRKIEAQSEEAYLSMKNLHIRQFSQEELLAQISAANDNLKPIYDIEVLEELTEAAFRRRVAQHEVIFDDQLSKEGKIAAFSEWHKDFVEVIVATINFYLNNHNPKTDSIPMPRPMSLSREDQAVEYRFTT